MAALIRHSDEYLGYDSACQHIAAAARTPTLTVFAGSDNMGFVRRSSACGATDCRLVHVDTLTEPQYIDVDRTVSRIMHERADRSAPSARPPRSGRFAWTNREASRLEGVSLPRS